MSTHPLRRDLRSVFSEGVLWSLMVGLGETWFAAFALALGFGEVTAGLLATVPLLIGAHLQLLSPLLVRLLGSRRRSAVLTASIQAAAFVPLVIGAALGHLPGILLLAAASIYWGAGQSTGTVWNAWMTQIIPRPVRHRFFARRSFATQIGVFLGLLGGGLCLEMADERGMPLIGFLLVFAVGGLARLGSVAFLSRVSERDRAEPDQIVAGRQLLKRIRHGSDGRLILFLILMSGSVAVASPFFTPYMLGPLGFSYQEYMALLGASFLTKAATLMLLGDLARRFGAGRLLVTGAVLVSVVPLLWIAGTSFLYLFALQMLSGAVWATFEFASFLLFLDLMDERDRTSLLTTLNLASAVTMVGGSLLGGAALHHLGSGSGSYNVLFLGSGVARSLVALLLVGVTLRRTPVPSLAFRILSLRPGAGGIIRPLWGSLRFPALRRIDRS